MLRALRLRGGHERFLVEPLGLLQHRGGDHDVIVEGERLDGANRRVRDRRQPPRQLGARGDLDLRREAPDHVVEHLDLLARILRGAGDEQVGDVPERIDAALGRARGDRLLKLGDE